MISRVKRMENLLILNAPPNLREILQAGPPKYVLKEMARLHELEAKTIERAEAAIRRLGWKSDEDMYGKEAVAEYRLRIARSAATAARLAKAAETAPEAPLPTKPGARKTAAGGPVQTQAEPQAAEITLCDYLPSSVTVDYAERLQRKGMLGAQSVLRKVQASIECGYICAEAVVRMLQDGRALTREEAGDAARTAMRQIEIGNFRLHHKMEEVDDEARPPLGPDPRYLDVKEVLCLIALSMNRTMDEMLFDSRLVIGPIADVEIRVQQLVDAGEPATCVIAGLTTQQREEGGYVPDSHWFFGFVRISGPSRKRAAAKAGAATKRGNARGQKRTMDAYVTKKPSIDLT